jgi:ribose transport system substrate-binding protein
MHFKRLVLLSFAGTACWLAGCSSSPHATTERYFLVTANIKVPYWQSAKAGLLRAAAELPVRAEMIGPDNYDPGGERGFLQDALRQQVKPVGILVSAADPNVMQPEIDAAIAQGVPVITMDADAPASKRLFFVGTDNYKAGVMGARTAAKLLNGKGTVAIYTMPEQANLKDRLRGYRDTLGEHPGIKIAQTIDIKGDPRIAFDRTMEMVEKNTAPDAFVCLEAIACPEIADVLDRKQVKGKVVVAMDTDQRTLEGIQKGTIGATIAQKPFTMAFAGLKMLDGLHHNPPKPLDGNWPQDLFAPVPAFVDTGATLVDKSNVDAFLKELNSAGKK